MAIRYSIYATVRYTQSIDYNQINQLGLDEIVVLISFRLKYMEAGLSLFLFKW
jgi:hypothetical protein